MVSPLFELGFFDLAEKRFKPGKPGDRIEIILWDQQVHICIRVAMVHAHHTGGHHRGEVGFDLDAGPGG